MLTKRIIPCMDIMDGKVVKGVNFVSLKEAGDPEELASRYADADELALLDISATSDKRKTMAGVVEAVARIVSIPITVGGGITTIDDITVLLGAGADKVSINTAAVRNPELIREASKRFGSQCIVVAVDVKRSRGLWNVFVKSGKEDTGLDAFEWIQKVIAIGAGEILLTSMDRDGTKDGYDLELLRDVPRISSVPVIASGGAGSLEDIYKAFQAGADAALAASIFHYGKHRSKEAKDYLAANGIEVRG